jgi:hypothetical protein
MSRLNCARFAAVFCLLAVPALFGASAQAQSALLNEVNTIAAPTQGIPVVRKFTLAAAGTFQVTLTDLGMLNTPSTPLKSLKLAITSGSVIVGMPITQLTNGTGTTTFTATAAGDYYVRVIGQPDSAAPGSGPFQVQIQNTADMSQVFSFSDSLALPLAQTSNVSVLTDTFTVPTSGSYTIQLTDLKFPAALNTVQLALTGGSSLLAALSASTPSATVTLQSGTSYSVFAFGQGTTAAKAGLYNVVVRDASSTDVYSNTLAVGALTSLGSFPLSAGNYTLSFADLAFPAGLSGTGQNGAIVVLDEQAAATLTAAGSRNFTASAATYRAYSIGTAASTPGTGSYTVQVVPAGSGAPALSVAEAVTTATSTTSGTQAYAFTANVPSAGSYNVQLTDFQLPGVLSNVSFAAVQGGAILGTPLTAGGSLPVSASAGTLTVLVFAQPPSGSGVFGLQVNSGGGGAPILETTQGVGGVFTSRKVSITTAGSYLVNVTDLDFPANFSSLYVIVTQGTTVVGSLTGGGALPFTASTTGDYFVTFTSQPAAPDLAGTYAISVGTPPAAPTLTLTSDVSHVASGSSANLTWSSQGATTCVASGAWAGGKALSGTANTGNLSSASTFTLACTGLGGTTTKSVQITIDATTPPPTGGGGGGGGALDLRLLACLAGGLLLRCAFLRRAALRPLHLV